MSKTQTMVAAERAAGARGGPGNRTPALKEFYTVVVYERKRTKTLVVYVGRERFVFKVSVDVEIRGVVAKQWRVGNTAAQSIVVHAAEAARLIDMYAHEEAARKISLLDDVYRAAALAGYKVHDNELYVKLWLSAPLGTPLFEIGNPLERELGSCIKHFTHSYGIWRMVTPPWATIRC
jgi:hypothetical protein